ncbi:MAG: hypothetical protein RO009_18785 [Pseudorhodoplanes sp.]|nr:hypothetical protein [Pseudorhodoplanes sp.]
MIIRDETAAYIDIVMSAVFGVAFANVAVLLGLYFPACRAVVKLALLVAHCSSSSLPCRLPQRCRCHSRAGDRARVIAPSRLC